MSTVGNIEDLLRQLAPRVLAALARRGGDFAAAEDAAQEALIAAAIQWPDEGLPDKPDSWLVTVASRRLVDQVRGETVRRHREERLASITPPDELLAPAADAEEPPGHDDTLTLLMLCCHPSLTPSSQIALTLRAAGGLTTAEVARAFLVPESTMARRISRAKRSIREAGARFERPAEEERPGRLRSVLHVLYLIFNEGHTATSGRDLQRGELTAEAIRLTRVLRELLPDDGEVAGLLALMLLIDARRAARTGADGRLIPLDEQDRRLWDRAAIGEGVQLITDALARERLGPYQLQAAIAAVHAEAGRAEDTDWPQIVALYGLLEELDPSPTVTLNRAVAVAMVEGPQAGLDLLESLSEEPGLPRHHRLHAVRAHLLEMLGDREAACSSYRIAAGLTTSLPEERYLQGRRARLESEAV